MTNTEIHVLSMNKSLFFAVLFVLLGSEFSWAVNSHILLVPENVNQHENDSCLAGPGKRYTLQHVLSQHEHFFASNTTIELTSGQYIVNESFGNILIENIEHFKVTSMNTTSTLIYCTQHATLGLYFLNATNVSISGIHFSHCNGETPNGRVAQLFQAIEQVQYTQRSKYEDYKCSIAFFSCSKVFVLNVVIDHTNGIGLLTLGTYNNFQLSECTISHNQVNIIVITVGLNTHSSSRHEYKITNSWIAYGNTSNGQIASGVNVMFAHEGIGTVNVLLQNLTLEDNHAREGNLLIVFVNCNSLVDDEFGNTVTALYNIFSKAEGQESSKKGLVITTWSLVCNAGNRIDQFALSTDNCKFVQGCIEVKVYFDFFLMSRTIVENTPCLCDYAVSFIPAPLLRFTSRTLHTIDTFSALDISACASEYLMKFEHFSLAFQGVTRFVNNDGTIFFENCEVTFEGDTLVSNSTSHESPLRIEDTDLNFREGSFLFQSNIGEQCGGITLIRSMIDLGDDATIIFNGNYGYDGGALAFYDGSEMFELGNGNTTIVFESNIAWHYGGGIFVDDASYQSGKSNRKLVFKCFNRINSVGVIYFRNNTAGLSGNALFGGWVDFCSRTMDQWLYAHHNNIKSAIERIIDVKNTNNGLYEISSNPSRVCICIDSTPQCNITNYNHHQPLFAGQTFHIQAVAVGQRFGTVPSTVSARFINSTTNINELQHVQNVGQSCTTLNYTIISPLFNVTQMLLLTVENTLVPEPNFTALQVIPYLKHQFLVFCQLTVTVTLSNCPLGYFLDNLSNTCACQKTLTKHGILCNIQNQTVIRKNLLWVNAIFVHTDSEMGNPGVMVHQNCPFDYCKNVNEQYLDLRYPDDQCAFNRSGILCGGCPQNYSRVFGTSKCKRCSSLWTILVLFLFVFSGIGFVALLISLNLTVSTGTINGLIFYAHIMGANKASFFPPQMTNTILSWFIAWLNLDLGIEMCFYDGLDAYTITWLQFLFPLYIWILVIVIIVSSHYYTFAARLSGSNAVQVLATLFLMSYAKMLRITITVFSSTTIEYPDGHPRRVWLNDGNVDFLKEKHIPLFIAALILLIFLSIPYTVVLFVIQWLRLLPSNRALFWVRKFKPLFDAYTGVYKTQHGYWTGLLLLVRMGLFLAFALNVSGDPSTNLLFVVATTVCLITYLTIFGGVYRQRHLNVIENSFLLNLIIVSAVTVHTRLEEHTQEKVTKTSVGMSLSAFVLIVFYHSFQRIKSTHKGEMYIKRLRAKVITPILDKVKSTKNSISAHTQPAQPTAKSQPTHTSIALREPLLIT